MPKTIAAALAAAILATLGALQGPARAEIAYPWCAQYNEATVGATNCGFVTAAQCAAALSGLGGACYENPRYRQAEPRPAKPVKPRH